MTSDEVKAALERAEKAFRAPWTYTPFTVECEHNDRPVCGEKDEDDCQTQGEVFRIESPDEYPDGQIIADVPGLEMFAEANGKFIAAARTDVPALCRDLLRAREALAKLFAHEQRLARDGHDMQWSLADEAAIRAALETK